MYKRTWNKKYGKSEIFIREDSYCQNVEIDMVRLADGQAKSYYEIDKEFGLVILGGKCTVEAKDFKYENIGERETVFDGNATCVYIPRNTDFTITGVGEVSIAVTKCPSQNDHKPVLIKPEDTLRSARHSRIIARRWCVRCRARRCRHCFYDIRIS